MLLLNLKQVSFHIGDRPILSNIDLQIKKGNKVALIGRNGTGKSTLMKLMTNEIQADGGSIERLKNLRIERLDQESNILEDGTVFDAVADHFKALTQQLKEYDAVIDALATDASSEQLNRLERLQHAIESQDGWQVKHRIDATLSKLELDANMSVSALSGGLKRRVALARAMITEPDLLLLDEPTNHLDMPSIAWLEEFLHGYTGSFILITHDRKFLNKVVNTTVELRQSRLISFPGNYAEFMERREALLEAEAAQDALFDKRLAQEEAWIREGVKARRTRNQGRVKKLIAMRKTHSQRIKETGQIRVEQVQSEKSGKRVIEAENIHFSYADIAYIRDFSAVIMRGEKIGILGPNGCGKTTLLKLLTQELQPTSGIISHGTRLNIRYFDQNRSHLDEEKTVIDNIGEGRNFIEVNGKNTHVISYLQDFLFSPERARQQAKRLSGGEKARLLLAKLFSYPSNLIIMDEPTNDLDIETIELLEEKLMNYPGTVLLVSHDRQFMENIATYYWAFEGQGKIREHSGEFKEWATLFKQEKLKATPSAKKIEAVIAAPSVAKKKAKMSYKEQRELEQLPANIEALEDKQQTLQDEIGHADFYKQDQTKVQTTLQALDEVNKALDDAMARWEVLEEK